MEIKILKKENDKITLKIKEDSHTFLQLFKEYLLKNGASFVGYYKDHPESKEVIYFIESKKNEKIIEETLENIKRDFEKLKEEVKNLKI